MPAQTGPMQKGTEARRDGDAAPRRLRAPLYRLGVVADLRLVELANALGLNMNLKMLRVLIVAGCALGISLTPTIVATVTAVATQSLRPADVRSFVVTPILIVMFYVGLAAVLAEILGKFRHAVSGHPNRKFFQGLDIEATVIYGIYVLPRVTAQFLFWLLVSLGVCAGLVLGGYSDGMPVWDTAVTATALIGIPLTFGTATVAAGLFAAARPLMSETRPLLTVALAGVAGVTAGAITTHWIVRPLLNDQTQVTVPDTAVLPAVAGLTLVMWIGAGASIVPLWRRLRVRSFSTPIGVQRRFRISNVGPMTLVWARILAAQRQHGFRLRVQVRIATALTTAVAVIVGARLAGLSPLGAAAGLEDQFTAPAIGLISLMLGLVAADLVVNDIGPHRYRYHMRNAVESGARTGVAMAAQAIALVSPVLLLSSLTAAGISLLLGEVTLLPLLAGVGAVSAAVIAETIFPPPRATDDTAAESIFTGIATLILAAIPVVIPLGFEAANPWFTPLGATALIGGAALCLYRRITRHS